MTRLLFAVGTVAAATAGALLALAARDLRRPWSWPVDDMAGVQQSDPWLEQPHPIIMRPIDTAGRGSGTFSLSTQSVGATTGGM